jgi:hypothetical protein
MTIMNTTNLTEVFALSVASEMEPQEITFDVLLEKYAKGKDCRNDAQRGLPGFHQVGFREGIVSAARRR